MQVPGGRSAYALRALNWRPVKRLIRPRLPDPRDADGGRRGLVALAYYLAFRFRFLDATGGIPDRYETMLWRTRSASWSSARWSSSHVSGLYRKWWRYFRIPDFAPVLRAAVISSVILLPRFDCLPSRSTRHLPRSVAIMDFLLTLSSGRRARRMISRMIARAPGARPRTMARPARCSSSAPARAARWWSARCSSTRNLGAHAIGFIDDDPRKRGMRLHGLKVLGTTDEIGAILDEVDPDEVIIAIPSAPGVLRGKVVARVPRARHPGADAADGLRAAARRRPADPPAARGPGRGRARPRAGEDGARPGRRLPAGQGRAGHRRRRLDRLGALSARSPACGRSCW